jgi:hypothetical protein
VSDGGIIFPRDPLGKQSFAKWTAPFCQWLAGQVAHRRFLRSQIDASGRRPTLGHRSSLATNRKEARTLLLTERKMARRGERNNAIRRDWGAPRSETTLPKRSQRKDNAVSSVRISPDPVFIGYLRNRMYRQDRALISHVQPEGSQEHLTVLYRPSVRPLFGIGQGNLSEPEQSAAQGSKLSMTLPL